MLAVGGDHRIHRLQGVQRAGGHRLLADVQVQEAADLARAVQLGGALLQAADAQHVAQQGDGELRRVGH
ncbi:hypothetical protein D3C81_1784400 [compost metagenome]